MARIRRPTPKIRVGVRYELRVEFHWPASRTRTKRLAELRKEFHLVHTSMKAAWKASRAILKLEEVHTVSIWERRERLVQVYIADEEQVEESV